MKIILKNISKHYAINGEIIKAVDDISCEFEPFEISSIVGKSGCGKTTLLKLIAQIEPLTCGQIICNEAKIGMSFQEARLFPWLNVEENLKFSTKNISEKQIKEVLEMLGLENFRRAYPSQISGGMAQRTSVGRTLLYNPDIFLADEIFSFLDYFTKLKLQEDILSIQQKLNKTMLIVAHNLDEAISLAKDIYIMKDGKFIEKISPKRTKNAIEIAKYKEQILSII